MNAPKRRLGWSLLAPLTLALVGCETSPTPPPAVPEKVAPSPAEAARAADAKAQGENEIKSMPVEPEKPAEPGKGASTQKLSDKEIAAIKELPADEQPVAMAQLMCPVSEQPLGAMGKPIKQTVDGKTAYLCCDSCEEKFKADPAKYLAKIEKK